MEAEKTAPEIARKAVDLIGQLFAVEKQAKDVSVAERLATRQTQSGAGRTATEVPDLERTVAAQASHGRSSELRA